MNYCVTCGSRLEKRRLENEGNIPFCKQCDAFRFPIFNTAVSMIMLNQTLDKILLIQQYDKQDNILVAGYVNQGESAEAAAIREISEEVGLTVTQIQPNISRFYEPSNTLMFNYTCCVSNDNIVLTEEVDKATWFSFEEARIAIKPDSLAQQFLLSFLDEA